MIFSKPFLRKVLATFWACIVNNAMAAFILHRTKDALPSTATFLSACRWAESLSREELQRVTAEVIERKVPAGGYVCRKGEPVQHWIGVIDGL